ATSEPGINGSSVGTTYSPSLRAVSAKLTPIASTFMSTSYFLTSGMSLSIRFKTSGPPYSLNCIAFMLFISPLLYICVCQFYIFGCAKFKELPPFILTFKIMVQLLSKRLLERCRLLFRHINIHNCHFSLRNQFATCFFNNVTPKIEAAVTNSCHLGVYD